jgi:hypothetical protein
MLFERQANTFHARELKSSAGSLSHLVAHFSSWLLT